MAPADTFRLRCEAGRTSSVPAPGHGAPASPDREILLGILDLMLARIAFMDRQRRFRFVNAAYAAALGLAPQDIIGRTVAQIRGPVHARHMAQHARAALAGQTVRWEGWYDDPQLGRAYYDTTYAPMRLGDSIVGFVVLVRDLTPLKRREEELAARTAQLEATLAGVADGVTIADAEERLVMCNQGFIDLFRLPADLLKPGVPREAFVRHRLGLGIRYPSEDKDAEPARLVTERTARTHAAGGVLTEDIEVLGRHLHVRRRNLPDGTTVSTFNDFTARVEAEQARQRQHDAMREAQQMGTMAALLGGVAHELKNPLSIVSAHAVLLQEEAADTLLAARAEAVGEAARQCGRIVSSLLSSVSRGRPKRQPVLVRDVVAMALELINHRLCDTDIRVITEMPTRLPPLHADPDQIVHLLANLLGNAATALHQRPGARILIQAEVAEADADRPLVLRVADNGPGIPPDLRERVFRPFFTTRPDGAGTGIGLALCRTIVQDHGGQITAEETPGGGATFTVRLPLDHAAGQGALRA
ncbi:MAG: ATP-binding protein [Rhodopila sp.]